MEYGDQQFFSVWTASGLGYFHPYDLQSNRFNPENLIFGFSIPRSADPINIFEVLMEVIKYYQEELGGTILNQELVKFDENQERKRLTEIVKAMKEDGYEPGSGKSLRTF